MAVLDSHRRPSRRQRGVALMIAIFAMVVISLLGLAVLTVSTNGSRSSQQASGLQSATNAAQAGAEEARALLRDRKGALSPVLQLLCPGGITPPTEPPVCSMTTVVYVLNYNGAPWLATDKYADPTFATEPDPFNGGVIPTGFAVPTGTQIVTSSLANIPGFKWARINVASENSVGQVVDSAKPGLAPAMLVYDSNASSGRFPCGPAVRTVLAPCSGSTLGTNPVDPQPILQITSYAVVNGYTRIVTEQVSRFPFGFSPPASVTQLGANPVYASGHSNNFTVSGVDTSGVYPIMPAMGGTSATAVQDINNGAFRDDCSHYGAQDPSCTGTPPSTITNVTQPSSSNPIPLNSSLNFEGTFSPPSGLLGLYSQLVASADVVCSPTATPGIATCPSSAGDGTGFLDSTNPGITVIEGNYTLPSSGGGTLLVTGNVTAPNNVTWNGLLLVIGTGKLSASGGGTPSYNGALFLANVCGNYGATDPSGAPADLTGAREGATACNTLGNSDFEPGAGGGNGNKGTTGCSICFNSVDLNAANYNRAFSILSYRERSCAPATGGAGACTLQDYIN
ncbi:MAG TPA: hypothetical protein VE996_11740 [Terriglobales bacterium]|nr:hypothetical protein [Terriglobales bacterium]